MHDDATLHALLADAARFDPEYRGGLSNHLPMALVALRRLGAGDERLREFAGRYATRLQPEPPAGHWEPGSGWRERLGEREAFADYRVFFGAWIEAEGFVDTLSQAVPWLMPGCGAAAFHGLIRTSYAVQAGHPGELADALAYWACRWLPLGPDDAPGTLRDWHVPRAALDALLATLADARAAHRFDAPLIFQRMDRVADEPAFLAAVDRLDVGERSLRELATLAAELYAASGDFTALHLVTSAHALRVLLPFVEEPDEAVRHYWHAYAAGAVVADLTPRPAVAEQGWEALLARAVASDDDHVVKLVDSAHEQARAYAADGEDGVWRRAAARVLAASAAAAS